MQLGDLRVGYLNLAVLLVGTTVIERARTAWPAWECRKPGQPIHNY